MRSEKPEFPSPARARPGVVVVVVASAAEERGFFPGFVRRGESGTSRLRRTGTGSGTDPRARLSRETRRHPRRSRERERERERWFSLSLALASWSSLSLDLSISALGFPKRRAFLERARPVSRKSVKRVCVANAGDTDRSKKPRACRSWCGTPCLTNSRSSERLWALVR